MTVTAYGTPKVTPGMRLPDILDASLPKLRERDIVIVTSKIVSICEGSIILNDGTISKDELVRKQSQWYMKEKSESQYGVALTITRGILIANAGIDESNGGGFFVLWPKDPDASANALWQLLRKIHGLSELGVILSDSHTTPLRWGVTGFGLSWCGFEPLKNYIGSSDVFGRSLRVTKANLLDGLAAAAVQRMGEGNEQTPLAVVRDAERITFQNRPPTTSERTGMIIGRNEDIYVDLIDSPHWHKGSANE